MKTIKPGIYYDMPAEEYHAIPALSSSALKAMLISPLECWTKHVDPNREDDQTTAAMDLGAAYHAMLLEGPEMFRERFFGLPDPDDYPNLLKSGEELRKACADRGLTKSGSLAEMSERLLDAGHPRNELWHFIMLDAEREAGKRINLKADDYLRVERAGQVFASYGLEGVFDGGKSEVSIIYEHPKYGLCKARIDKLKARAAFDLKTFSNRANKEIEMAAAHTFVFERHHVQAFWYRQAIEVAFGRGWIEKPEDRFRFYMVYHQTGAVPNVVVREVAERDPTGRLNNYWIAAKHAVELAADRYVACLKQYGVAPWIGEHHIKPFDDTEFPSYMIED